MEGYIMNSQEVSEEMVSEEEILQVIFEACPQVVALPDLLYLISYPKLYDYYNPYIVLLLKCYREFKAIINKHFIEVCEDGSFDYDYGDISSTHHCLNLVGYVKRTPEMEERIIYEWDMDWY